METVSLDQLNHDEAELEYDEEDGETSPLLPKRNRKPIFYSVIYKDGNGINFHEEPNRVEVRKALATKINPESVIKMYQVS